MLLFPNEQDAERDATFCVCTWESGLPRRCSLMAVDLTERERNRQISDVTFRWNPKYDTSEIIYRTETDSQIRKTHLWLLKRKGSGGEINQEFGISRHKLLYIK